MADQYTEVTKRGYGSRMGGSFVGILIGILLIIGSVWVLFSNEGRVDTSQIAISAIEIPSAKPLADSSLEGKLVATYGALSSNQLLGDGQYLKPGRSIVLRRLAEMFSWAEEKSSKSKQEMGGSETTETTYSYKKKWAEKPADSSAFRYPAGHENPAFGIESEEYKVSEARVGLFDFDPSMITFPSLTNLQLSAQKLNLPAKVKLVSKRYLFSGKGSINAPEIGDIRISYFSLPEASKVTAFGKLAQNSIVPFLDSKGTRLYRMFYGTKDEAVATLRGADVPLARVLAIGDSVRTDLLGASAFGVDCLFVTAGIHATELGGREMIDHGARADMFGEAGVLPKAVTRRLVW